MPLALLFLTRLTCSLMEGFKCEATKLLLVNLPSNMWLACGPEGSFALWLVSLIYLFCQLTLDV